ncbi:MAG: penicillin-binding protein activator [Burkholderiaceae bacterium]|nr:penicillin-binding protein activator [Burkholderiaceae bacterium]
MNHARKLQLYIFCAIAVALSACSTAPQEGTQATLPVAARDRTVEDALQLKDDGKASDAASVMLEVSERVAHDLRAQYLFEAGQLYYSVPDARHAGEVLRKLNNTAPNSGYTKILKAQLALLAGQTQDAIAVLGSTAPIDIAPVSKGIFWLTLAKADETCAATQPETPSVPATAGKNRPKLQNRTMSACTQDALRARAEANDSLTSPSDLSQNQDALWRLMAAQSTPDLQALKAKSASHTLQAWLDLALLARKSKNSVPNAAINAWSAKYADQVVLNQRLLALRGLHPEKLRHVAVILPTKSKDLGRFAKAVWDGFQSAQKNAHEPYPIKLYETDASPAAMLAAYRSALDKGANLIVGPLSRSSLSLLTQRRLLAVPTVALNVVEEGKYPINLYQFGLPIAQEARVVARGAKEKGFSDAIVLKGNTALDARSSEAFIDEWTQLHQSVKGALPVQDLPGIGQLASGGLPAGTMIFVAADFQSALPAIKAMPENWSVFGTSALNTNSPEVAQLNKRQKIYFVDVPDLAGKNALSDSPLQTGKPDAVLTRLHALGIDAYRFSKLLMRDELRYNRPLLNGETGKLSVTRSGNVERDLPLLSLQHASLASYHADDLAKLAPPGER